MSYSVSSGFAYEITRENPTLSRKLYIGGSDYSYYVKTWPRITRHWNEIKPSALNITLANQSKTFNFFIDNPTTITTSATIQFGVKVDSAFEYINVFKGFVTRPSFQDGNVKLRLEDKLIKFASVVVGTSDVPVSFTSSNYLPSDIAWYLATSYGGFSAVQSTSNPDIDYAAFSRWAAVFSSDSVKINAQFTGQKLSECMSRIGKLTRSGVVVENDKLTFSRYDTNSVAPYQITSGHIIETKLEMDIDDIINDMTVQAAYDVTSKYFTITTRDVSTYSVNSYGRHQQIENSDRVWYSSSGSAINLAQRMTTTYREPPKMYTVSTGVCAIGQQLGDVISFTDSQLNVTGDSFRIMGYSLDTDSGKMDLNVDTSQLLSFFILDDATYGMLDQVYNPLN